MKYFDKKKIAMLMSIGKGQNMQGIKEYKEGEFSVSSPVSGTRSININMNEFPDLLVVYPKYPYDTQDNNLLNWMYNGYGSVGKGFMYGRRSVSNKTVFYKLATLTGDNNTVKIDVHLYSQLRPKYIDDDGNEGKQVYIWKAIKIDD